MTGAELTQWAAWEAVHGPVLLHERIDIGLATVAFTAARAAGAKKQGGDQVSFRDFLPPWLREAAAEASVRRGMEALRLMAMSPDHGVGEDEE